MVSKFPEHKKLDLSEINKAILNRWTEEKIFDKSLSSRDESNSFVFYEGPPSANGKPGIHHVIARTIKDIFCRYQTLKGKHVKRKAGWDTHGLPVELGVEKALGITKEDIGDKVSVSEYNDLCRKDVMKYTREWEDLTRKMGYWVDMENPYITYDNRYIETLWYLLKQLFEKDLLYKGYSIQPYSPAAGTGLSTHELNQPGCYRDVKDTTCVAQFEVVKNDKSAFLFADGEKAVHLLAWTTTPWTLPSNTALAVGKDITYKKIKTFNPYTGEPVNVVVASDLASKYFPEENKELLFEEHNPGDKKIPWKETGTFTGSDLAGVAYTQLIDWVQPEKPAFRVVTGDFVTTEDGTGIVHIAPTFGADDYRVAAQNDIPPLIVKDKNGNIMPLVDKKGRFVPVNEIAEDFRKAYVNESSYESFSGRFVKNAYDPKLTEKDPTVDIDIAVMLKKDNKAFRVEKHVHNYPHCWRTDKPVLYYPLDSWFVRTTALRERMMELNNEINWKPQSTGSGRFGKWLENLVDWNLSRSRYWGTPLPVWVSEDGKEQKCIGSVKELKEEAEKAVAAGIMDKNPLEKYQEGDNSAENYSHFDLHRPFVDNIMLVSESGRPMTRETDLIDVWFDSGAMPYAQMHYPFENADTFEKYFPADFIAEGVDQTRGWFFTLHAIATMVFDSKAFKNIISNGLVLDKNGNKMSKRLGNSVDSFEVIAKHGSDPLRWYMIANAQPWDNIKFDVNGIDETSRKFFSTLYNTYSFFALYANVDNFTFHEEEIPVQDRPEIDRWILSLLHSLIAEVDEFYSTYEPTRAARAIQDFVTENLSNWYVRLNRKRFWGGNYDNDKIAAYQTLYTCLETVARLTSPIAPFYADKLFLDLNAATQKDTAESVHLAYFPVSESHYVDKPLEERMEIAQKVSSMVLGLRRKVNIKVRQPLQKIMIPATDKIFIDQVEKIKSIVMAEVNVKEIEYLSDTSGILVKRVKPDFKKLGPRYGKLMKKLSAWINKFTQEDIQQLEKENRISTQIDGEEITLTREDVEIISEDIPGWLVANEGNLTLALDVTITDDLRYEGVARELVNRIQNIRKDSGYDVTDKIRIVMESKNELEIAVEKHREYISMQTLANSIELQEEIKSTEAKEIEIEENLSTVILVEKI